MADRMRASSWRPRWQFALPSFPPSADDVFQRAQFARWSPARSSPPTKTHSETADSALVYVFPSASSIRVFTPRSNPSAVGSCPGYAGLSLSAPSPGASALREKPAAPCHPPATNAASVVLARRRCGSDGLDHARIRQRGRVAQRHAVGDIAKEPSHDLARAGLRQLRREHDRLGPPDPADRLDAMLS